MTAILRKVEKTFTFEDQRVEVNELAWDVYNLSLGNAKLTDFSVVVNANSGTGNLTFDDTTGEFEYTPPDLSQFLTSYTETDPVFVASVAYNITSGDVTNWNNAHSWGDHSLEGYIKGIGAISLGALSDVDTTTNAPAAKDHLVFDGTNWVPTSPEANVFISDAPPANPDVGDLWYESDKGALKIYYEDADSSQWVDTNVLPISSGAGITLDDLSVITDNPLGGGGLVYDNTTGEFTFTPANVLSLSDFSVTTASPSGGGSLTYLTGTFTYTPPDLSTYLELTDLSVNVASPNGNGTLTYSDTTGVFTYTPPDLSSGTSRYSLPVATTTVLGGVKIDGTTITINNGTISAVSSGGGSTNVSIGTTAPTNATAGDLWWNSTQGQLKIYYNDGNSSQWVDACGPNGTSSSGGASVTVSDTAPTSPSGGDLWWNSSQGQLKIYYSDANSSQWVDTAGGGGGTISSLNDIGDVNVGTVITGGHVLKWDDQNDEWIAGPDATSSGGSGIALTDISVTKPNPAASGSGDVTYNSTSGAFTYTPPDLSSFSTFSGSYNDLTNQPTIPAAQVKADWNATTGLAEILNKPTIPSSYSLPVATTTVLGGVKIDGTSITISNGVISSSGGGGSTSPGGSDTQFQWNDDGDFGGTSKITWDNSNSDLVFEGTNVSNALRWDSSQSALRLESSSVEMQFVGGVNHTHTIGQSGDYLMVSAKGSGAKLYLDATSTIKFITASDAANVLLEAFDDGPVNLYHGYSKKFETTISGVQVTGGIQDKDGDLGNPGQVLSSTGAELDWIDPISTGIPVLDVTNWSSTPDDNVGTGKTGTINRAAFEKAIGSLSSTGGIIYVPHGDYQINGTINITNTGTNNVGDGGGIVIMGPNYRVGAADSEGARLIAQDATSDIFKITNVRNVEIKQLAFDSAVTRTGGSAIHCYSNTNTQQIKLERLYIRQQFGGIKMDGHSMSIIRDIEMRHFNDIANSYGLLISASQGGSERVDQIRCQNVLIDGEVVGGNSNPGNAGNNTVGIQIKDFTNSVWFDHCVANRCKYGMDFHTSMPSGGSGNPGSFFRVNDCDFDTNSFCGINVEGGSFIWINSPYISSNKYNGLRTTSNFTGVLRINDADCRGNSEHGILLNSSGHKKVMINNPQCCENGVSTWSGTGNGNGIDIGNGVNDVQIQGGQCGGTNMGETIGTEGDFNRSARAQKYGIHFNSSGAGIHHRCTVAFVDCTDNATDPIQFNVAAGDFNYLIGVAGNGQGSTFFNS